MPPPPLPSEIQYRKLKKEICVFAIFLGVLLMVAGYFSYTGISRTAQPFMGIAWHVVWGVPMMAIGVIHLIAGILLALTSWRIWVYLVMVGGVLLALDYCIIMAISTGTFPVNLMTLVVLAVPAVVIHRGLMFLKLRPQVGVR